jgi:hypothetical protein
MRSASPATAETGKVPAGAASAGADGGASSPVSGACSLLRAHQPVLVRVPPTNVPGTGVSPAADAGRTSSVPPSSGAASRAAGNAERGTR